MASLSALAGASLAWLVVLLVSTGAGAGVVVAWTRWGARVPLPPRIRAPLDRLFGAPRPNTANVSAEEDDPPGHHERARIDQAPREEPEVGLEPTAGLSVGAAGAATAEELGPTPEETQTVPEHDAPMATPITSRTDAIEELCALFGVSYEDAVALLEAGLWGLDNHEEWTRSMRQGARLEKVPEATMQRVLAKSKSEIAPELEAFRTKRRALRELEALWGVGPEQAEALFAAGFDGREAIKRATTEKLSRVEGIGRALAFQIRAAAHDLAPTP